MIYPDDSFFEELADQHRISGERLIDILEDAYRAGRDDAFADAPGKAYRVRNGDHVHPKTYSRIGPAKQARSYHPHLKGAQIEELVGYWRVVD